MAETVCHMAERVCHVAASTAQVAGGFHHFAGLIWSMLNYSGDQKPGKDSKQGRGRPVSAGLFVSSPQERVREVD